MKKLILITALAYMSSASLVFADDHSPHGKVVKNPTDESAVFFVDCKAKNYTFADQNVSFNTTKKKQQRLFLLHNKSNAIVYVDHSNGGGGMGAGWSSQLGATHWSSIAVNKPNFVYNCRQQSDGKTIVVNCGSVLQICELTKFTLSAQNPGTYWFVEDKSLNDILDQSAARLLKMPNGKQ